MNRVDLVECTVQWGKHYYMSLNVSRARSCRSWSGDDNYVLLCQVPGAIFGVTWPGRCRTSYVMLLCMGTLVLVLQSSTIQS